EPGDVEPPPVHPRRSEDDRGGDLDPAVDDDVDPLARGVQVGSGRAAHDHPFRTDLLRLAARPARELGAAYAVGKAEEVLDHRGVRGLPARNVAFEDDRRETVRAETAAPTQAGAPR